MQGPILPSHVRVIPIRDAPCECLPPPFKCWVATENELPPDCDTNGDVMTVLSVPWCDHPVQFFCWGGEWYPLVCDPEPTHIRVEADATQYEYGLGGASTTGFKIGAASTWNTLYNEGGFTVMNSGDIVIPKTGLYHLTGSTTLSHLTPPDPVDLPTLPWPDATWSASLQFIRSSPYLATYLTDQVVSMFKYATAPLATPLGTRRVSTPIDICIATDYYFLAGQTVNLSQDFSEGVPTINPPESAVWVSRGNFTLRKVG